MKKLLALGAALLMTCTAFAWHTDLGAAQSKAYAENRIVLVNFTGSDWCGWCIRLKDEVFMKPEFERFAANHLVLVEIDFPRRKAQSAAQKQANKALAEKYFVQGYPSIVLLNSKGDKIGELGYMQGGPQPFINAVQELAGLKGKGGATPAGTPPALFNGAPSGPPPKYKELTLKSINGAGKRKLALINNQTFGVGESARVRLGEGEVKVRCEEIRERSVIVTLDGKRERRELRLTSGATP